MNEETIKFLSEVVKPWETLNQDLGRPFSMNSSINDFITKANALAVTIKHLPESTQKISLDNLTNESQAYKIMFDLADSIKHGALRKPGRDCKLSASSMFERNSEAKVRFLRSRITIMHSTFGKIDFMECAMDCATFISQKMGITTNWSPKVLNNSGDFSDEIRVHASKTNQVAWTGMTLEFVEINAQGEYVNVDLNGEVKFVLTSEF